MRPIALMPLIALLLAGCAGYSPECVTGTGTKDCATGTLGHQQMTQEKQGDETLASIEGRTVTAVARNLLYGACVHLRVQAARQQGVRLPEAWIPGGPWTAEQVDEYFQ